MSKVCNSDFEGGADAHKFRLGRPNKAKADEMTDAWWTQDNQSYGFFRDNLEIALDEKDATIESLRAEVATLKRIDDVGIITNQNQHSEIDKLKAQLSRLKEIMTHLVLIREALSKTWEEGV